MQTPRLQVPAFMLHRNYKWQTERQEAINTYMGKTFKTLPERGHTMGKDDPNFLNPAGLARPQKMRSLRRNKAKNKKRNLSKERLQLRNINAKSLQEIILSQTRKSTRRTRGPGKCKNTMLLTLGTVHSHNTPGLSFHHQKYVNPYKYETQLTKPRQREQPSRYTSKVRVSKRRALTKQDGSYNDVRAKKRYIRGEVANQEGFANRGPPQLRAGREEQ